MSALRTPGTSRLRSVGPTRPLTETAPRVSTPPDALFKLFAESVFGMPPWMLQARLSDFSRGGTGVPLGVATGTPSDRKGGRDVPRFWSEIDLRGYRILARHVTESNPFGIGFLGTLTDYHVRKGYGWQACKPGTKKTPYPTTGAPVDPVVAKGQRILDEFRNATKWPLKSREAFRRWVRDGEVIGRWFYGGQGRLPEYRFGEPDNLGSPTGNTEGDDSFGIATPHGDAQGAPTDYHFWNEDGLTGEWVGADRVTFAKRGTDSGVKRGITDFHPIASELEDCTKLVRTMLATAIRQAGTAWIEKFPGRTLTQVAGAVPEFAPGTGYSGQARAPFDSGVPWWLMPQVGGGLNPWEPPGVVRKVEGDREYQPGPTSSPSGYIEVEQSALRGCGVIWRCPEYFTGDASNNNMASLIVAGSPFTICVESNQFEWGAVWERECALKVLDLATLAGLLTRDERRELDVETTEPAVVVSDPGKDYETISRQLQDKVICLDTARQKSGYDPQHEAEGVKKDAAEQPPDGGGGGGGGPGDPSPTPPGSGDPLGDLFGESFSDAQYQLLTEAGKAGLVQKDITFQRDGKSITQKRWVKADAPAPAPKPSPAPAPAPTTDPAQHAARAERRRRDAVAAEHLRATAQEPPRPKHLIEAAKFKDVARRRRIIASLKTEAELAEAVGGFNEPDSRPADVLYVEDAQGNRVTEPDKIRNAMQLRDASVKILKTGKIHTIKDGKVVATETDADEGYRQQAQDLLARRCEAFEVKTMLTSAKNQVYMNPKAKRRKDKYADRYFVSFHVVAVDKRRGQKHSGHDVYVAPYKDVSRSASGTVKLDEMKKVDSLAGVMGALS